jgi:hypothetical protein
MDGIKQAEIMYDAVNPSVGDGGGWRRLGRMTQMQLRAWPKQPGAGQAGGAESAKLEMMIYRPISVYSFPRRALTLCPQLCMGMQPGARCPAQSADALSATLHGHFTETIYRNRPILRSQP